MTLPGEIGYTKDTLCECGELLEFGVMMSAAGYYLGLGGCPNWNCDNFGESSSRETGYFETRDEASNALKRFKDTGYLEKERI